MSTPDTSLKVAAIQMTSVNDKKDNLEKAERFICVAAREGAEIVALPEMFNFSGKLSEKKENAEPIPGPTVNRLRELARRLKIYLLCGSILERAKRKGKNVFCNTSIFLNPQGKIMVRYRKMHLFDVSLPDGSWHRESALITPGDEIVQIVTPVAIFGFSICYDLRFPELYRRLAQQKVQVVFIPAAFTLETGKDHWEVLVRARAIESQFYIIAPNQTGEDTQGKRSWGKSMIVDPWGTVLAKAPEKETVILAIVDLSYQRKIRENLPCLSHMRKELFESAVR